jgi:hypothetical protein
MKMYKYRYIKVETIKDKVIIQLNNPPVNAENLRLLNEINTEIMKHDYKTIIFWGHQQTSKGRNIFSAGGDISELQSGRAFEIATLINRIIRNLNNSHNYVVTIMGGDGVGGGWGMPFDISDKIYYLEGSSIICGFTKNAITPGCGMSLLISMIGSIKAYKFLRREGFIELEKLEKIRPDYFESFKTIEDIPSIIKFVNKGAKCTPQIAQGALIEPINKHAQLINELITKPQKLCQIQLKYLKASMSTNS